MNKEIRVTERASKDKEIVSVLEAIEEGRVKIPKQGTRLKGILIKLVDNVIVLM